LSPLLDRLDHVHALGDLAEDGVHAVQVLRVALVQHDEELAAAGVGARVRHRERAGLCVCGLPRVSHLIV
jgi:hypothetical protein